LIKGTVAKTFEKEWPGQDGTVILHSFQIQGDKRYFRTGTDKLFSQGDSIQFDVEGNNQVVTDSVVKLAAQVATAPAPATGGYQRPAWQGGGKPKTTENFEARQKYWENKELRDIEVVEPRITWSSSRTAAIEVIGLALQHDAIAFGNAAKGAKLGMILDFVDEVAARFYHQSMAAAETAAGLEGAVGKEPAKKGAASDE
jgi:hypothetical protein